jgi:competence protein ComEA
MYPEFLKIYRVPVGFGIVGVLMVLGAIVVGISSNDDTFSDAVEIVQIEENADEYGYSDSIAADIQGAVVSPGVYSLDKSARVFELLEKAGGIDERADFEWIAVHINRAQKLVDGTKIYIPFKNDTSILDEVADRDYPSIHSVRTVNINTASMSQLEALSGIGVKTAEKIVNGRPYGSIEELRERGILGVKLFEKLEAELSVF